MELELLLDCEKAMEVDKFRREIKSELKAKKENLGYSYTELGRYLSRLWKINEVYAAHWIIDLDNGNLISRLNRGKKINIELNRRKLSDYLSAIGASKTFREEITKGIAKLYPGFKLPKSKVKSYQKNK